MAVDASIELAAMLVTHCYSEVSLGFLPGVGPEDVVRYALELLASDGGKALKGRPGAQAAAVRLMLAVRPNGDGC
jgi:hypothetical protein